MQYRTDDMSIGTALGLLLRAPEILSKATSRMELYEDIRLHAAAVVLAHEEFYGDTPSAPQYQVINQLRMALDAFDLKVVGGDEPQ